MLRMGNIVLTVDDLDRAIAFWTRALGYVADKTDDDWANLDPPEKTHWSDPMPTLSLYLSGYPQHYPPRIHLDLYAEDQAAEVARLLELGAHTVDWDNYPDDADWIVLEDTEGNRFCVVDTGPFDRPRREG